MGHPAGISGTDGVRSECHLLVLGSWMLLSYYELPCNCRAPLTFSIERERKREKKVYVGVPGGG